MISNKYYILSIYGKPVIIAKESKAKFIKVEMKEGKKPASSE
ncbi:chromosomal protein MC1a [Paramecium bursaria Chlorella virus Can18-4]|nr:chromosomal protein MC1a [Paramecium bursaria Chlorella virus Can18-4]